MKKLLLFAFAAGLLALGSCSKSGTGSETILYSVQVVSGANLAGKTMGTMGLTGATVATNQAGKVSTVTTDASGIATFTLNPGVIAVTVSAPNQTTLNYTAQLTYSSSTNTCYNSTQAVIFPISGNGTASVSGIVTAHLDQTSNNLQNVPDGTGIDAYINVPASPQTFVNQTTGQGTILTISYESAAFHTTTTGGTYSLTLPATGMGLAMSLTGDQFAYNTILPGNTFQRNIYSAPTNSVTTWSGQNQVIDINY